MSLGAMLAWVGLGADGLSSSCYGPEAGYLALGEHHFLAIPLTFMMVFTVLLLTSCYAQVVELFPSRGGGYVVASKLLGEHAGLVSGCALLVDYILTIGISIASGVDALFSLLPMQFQKYKLMTAVGIVILLLILNLRGVKESVLILLPIFCTFFATHIAIIGYGILSRMERIPALISGTHAEFSSALSTGSIFALVFLLFKAYSLGAGTYTGIEAVSNSTDILREPKTETAKKTLFMMGFSLAFVAGGLFLCYMLFDLSLVPGKTLNAVLLENAWIGWNWNGVPIGWILVTVTLMAEGALLFVAAQSGFVSGPRVMANMALDNWLPRRFINLSDRLVVENGVFFMGISAIALMLVTGGKVSVLVILYSINVFITFLLSTLGLTVHWTRRIFRGPRVWFKWGITAMGTVLSGIILIIMCVNKLYEGAWITLIVTLSLIMLCLKIRRHYTHVMSALNRLQEITDLTPLTHGEEDVNAPDPKKPTAVLLVKDFDGVGVHSVWSILRLFGRNFRNFVFLSAGVLDFGQFKGVKEVANLQKATEAAMQKYVQYCRDLGYYATYRYKLGTDPLPDLEQLCQETAKEFPLAVFFGGQLIFDQEGRFTQLLHNNTSFVMQRRLQFKGLQMVILPIRVSTLLPGKPEAA